MTIPHDLSDARISLRKALEGDVFAATSSVEAILGRLVDCEHSYYRAKVRSCAVEFLQADSICDILIALAELRHFMEGWHAPKPDASNRPPDLMT